jgi:aerobic carbon-monoxide dehydrogenase large subunit
MGYIGQRRKRIEDPPLLTGHGQYVSDLRLPGMVHLALVRSPHAHARVQRVDKRQAATVPGVLGVFDADDLAEIMKSAPGVVRTPGARLAAPTPLAREVVRYVGEAMAVVVAEDRYVAEDAVEAVVVDYVPLPAVVTVEQDPATAPILHPGWPSNVAERFTVTAGDGARALERADHIVEATLRVGRFSAQPLEPRAVVATYDETAEVLTVYHATQSAHNARRGLSAVLGMPEDRIRVVAPDVGGAFGVKNRQYAEEVLASYFAMKLKRPVKWVGDRREEFLSTNQGRSQVHYVRLGLDAGGQIVVLVDHFLQDAGAYNITAGMPAHNTALTLQGPYRVPHLEVACDVVLTTMVPTGPYRGAGRPEAAYVMERILDRAADALGIDRIAIRQRNLIQPHEMPYSTGIAGGRGPITYDAGDYPAGFQHVLDALDSAGFRHRQAAERQRGVYLGIGVVNSIEMAGIGIGEKARIRIESDGTITVMVGVPAAGQGHRTAFAQIAAERLGVPIERVTVMDGDTALMEESIGTFASRSLAAVGNAISIAARRLRQRVLEGAADLLEAAVPDLTWDGDVIAVRGAPSRAVPYWAVVAKAGAPLEEEALPPAPPTFAFGSQGIVVDVDPHTMRVRILDHVICHDGGAVVNPLLADGQTIGAAVQGLGTALWEDMRFDGEGHPLTTSFADYILPGSVESPDFRLIHQRFPAQSNQEGFRGLAEGGAIPSMALLSQAIEDALSPYGVRLDEVPITPQNLYEVLAPRLDGEAR